MARSRAGMRLLHDGATYAQALESRVEREIEEQRQAEEAAALAKAKPKGPLRLGRVVSEFLYFAAWVGLAPFPILRDTVSSAPRLEKEWWSHVSGVAPSPRPSLLVWLDGSSRQALGSKTRVLTMSSRRGSFTELVAL